MRLVRFAARLLGLAVFVAGAGGAPAGTVAPDCPNAGSDTMDSTMSVVLDVLSAGSQTVELTGPVTVVRSDARLEDDANVIDTEIVSMSLTGDFFGQPIEVRVNPERSSVGEVRSQGPTGCFAADSFFDVFVEVEIPNLVLVNLEPVRVGAANLNKLPPLFDTYTHPPPAIPLVQKGTAGPVLAMIEGESSHRPEQDPVFGLAPGSLDPATGYALPKPLATVLTRAGLGLQSGDDLISLSFGRDAFDAKGRTTLAFSVDPASLGVPGTGVNQEAVAQKAEGGEFVTFVNGTNQTVAPAEVFVPVPGDDDLDSLTEGPVELVDFDGNAVPDAPVFYTLAPGSPTLAAIGAGPDDVLVTAGGAAPMVFAAGPDYGLQAGDVTDAICLMKTGLPTVTLRPGSGPPAPPAPGPQVFDAMLFSLAPGSPTLSDQGHQASDVFVTDFSNSRPLLVGQPLAVYAEESELGLLADDDLNALKCLRGTVMVEVDPFGDLDGPGNGTGCQPAQVSAAVLFDKGLENHDADFLAPPSALGEFGYFDNWKSRNPGAGDVHGPFAWPQGPAAGFMPEGDPAQVAFVGGPGDNCGLPHIHGGLFGILGWDLFGFHADPDSPACGHGVYLPNGVPTQVIETARDAFQAAAAIAQALRQVGVAASWHAYDGPPTNPDPTDCQDPAAPRAALIFDGLALTQFDLSLLGPYTGPDLTGGVPAAPVPRGPGVPMSTPLPVRIGPPLPSLGPPLLAPEPGAGALALAALATLARLRGRRGAMR